MILSTHAFNRLNPRSLVVCDGTLEALKWIALILMTGDHINKYLFNGTNNLVFAAGRVAMPIFVFVLAYNLARPESEQRGVYQRTMQRLAVFGVLSTPAYLGLGGVQHGWWPLNILFTLLVLTAILRLMTLRTHVGYVASAALFFVAGFVVEYCWEALALGIAAWWYCRQASWVALAMGVSALSSLWLVNSNGWALATLPAIWIASCFTLTVPRRRWAFYWFYPIHLAVLWLIRIPMRNAGYIFF